MPSYVECSGNRDGFVTSGRRNTGDSEKLKMKNEKLKVFAKGVWGNRGVRTSLCLLPSGHSPHILRDVCKEEEEESDGGG